MRPATSPGATNPDPQWSGAAATANWSRRAWPPTRMRPCCCWATSPIRAAPLREFTDCYDPTWGRFKDRTWPSPGNHEYLTPGARGYFDYFGSAAGAATTALKLGSWQVYSLDSNLAAGRARGPAGMAEAANWRANPSHCTLAYWHHPLYSSGGHGSIARMRDAWQALQQAGAEIVLSGHDHDYERFAPQDANGRLDDARGIRQFVVGTGGAYADAVPVAAAQQRNARQQPHRRAQAGAEGRRLRLGIPGSVVRRLPQRQPRPTAAKASAISGQMLIIFGAIRCTTRFTSSSRARAASARRWSRPSSRNGLPPRTNGRCAASTPTRKTPPSRATRR